MKGTIKTLQPVRRCDTENLLQARASSAQVSGLFARLAALLAMTVMLASNAMALALPDFESLVKEKGKAVVKISVTTEQKLASGQRGVTPFNQEQIPEFFRKYFAVSYTHLTLPTICSV